MSVQRTIAHNTVFNTLGRIWEAVLGLVLTWYIYHRLGWEGYGLWSLVGVFIGYAALLDFGVGSGFAKYLAEYAARDRRDAVSAVISTGLFFYLALGVLVVAAGWPLAGALIDGVVWLLARLHPGSAATYQNAAALAEVRFLCRGALVLFAFTNCIAPFSALQTGLQRMGVTNLLSFAASLLKLGATVVFLELGYGVPGLLYANGLVLAAFGAGCVFVAYRIFPGLRVGPGRVSRRIFRELFGFGWRTQVAKLSNLINFQTDRAIVGLAFADMALVGIYRAGEDLAGKVRQLPALLVSALLPAVSDLDARGRDTDVARLYLRSTKYMAAAAVPLTAFVIGCAGPLLRIVFGDGTHLEMSAWVLRILTAGYAANLLAGPGMSIALGKGRPEMSMYAGLLSMAANIGLTVLLVWRFGFYGVPVATAAAMLLSAGWFFTALRRRVDVRLRDLLRTACIWPVLAAAPGFAASIGIVAVLEAPGRLASLAAACAGGAVLGLSYLALIRLMPFLDAFDVRFLEETLHLGRVPGFHLLVGRTRHG